MPVKGYGLAMGRGTKKRSPLVMFGFVGVVCAAIVFAGAELGAGVIVGDQAYVRERAVIGRIRLAELSPKRTVAS